MDNYKDTYIFPKDIRVSCYKGYPSKGDPINITTLHDVLFHNPGLENIDPNAQKGVGYAVQFYVNNILDGTSESTFTDGIIAIDIDKIAKEDCKTIYDNFDCICRKFNGLLCCTYSNSYFNPEKKTGGLHLIVRTDRNIIYRNEYKDINCMYAAAFAYVVYQLFNIDIRPRESYGLDSALKSIAHRFFLNYSTVQWNEYASPMSINDDIAIVIKDWFDEEYIDKKNWFEKKSDYKIVECEFKSIDTTTYTGGKVDLGWKGRINVINALHHWGVEDSSILKILLDICGPQDWEGDKKNPGALRRSIEQSISTSHNQTPTADQLERAKKVLENVGIEVDMHIKKIYQPFEFDDGLIDMYAAPDVVSDYPIHNVHYNPENYLKLQLGKDQYLTDYKHQITEMINKYQMTYLVADCMVGKTTYALNMQNEYGLFDDSFVVHFGGDTFDVCVPYNSVADNKAKGGRKDIKRVTTADISKFGWEKRNVFIWNTVMPLYDKYFKMGFVKRLVLFFDESQKIVTDDYRWETIFEMFKVLPDMYKHFVFMTGTPAGELEYLKQYFNDYCIIKVDKEIDYNRECKILKYKHFGDGDRVNIIEEAVAAGRLPLIYSNSKKESWENACRTINKRRIEVGLKPYRVLVYSRDNADKLSDVNASNSISGYDIVIATKYCSVGIDFKKDDHRMRSAIIDFASERDCTLHDIWQFTLRNRNQDTITKIIVHDDESYNEKLYNYWYYQKFFDDMAKIHTYRMVKPEFDTEESQEAFAFAQEVFQIRKFGQLVCGNNNYFNDVRNVKLLGIYYLYRKIFSNINIIKHMLKRRGVEIIEVDMEHTAEKLDNSNRKEIYKWFVDNFETISNIYSARKEFETVSYQIDINTNMTESIVDNKIYSRSMHYMDWLILQFAGKNEWLPILQEHEYLTKETFAAYNRMMMIAKRITKREIDKIKRLREHMIESDIDDMVVDMIEKHYGKALDITTDEIRKAILLRDVIDDYKKILRFAIDNIEFIDEIKNATEGGEKMAACHKMKIAMDQKEQQRIHKAQSDGAKKRNSKPITIRILKDDKVVTFDSMQDAANCLGCTKQTLYQFLKRGSGNLKNKIAIVN